LMRRLGEAAQLANGHERAQEIGRDVDPFVRAGMTFAGRFGILHGGAAGAGALARTTFAHGTALASPAPRPSSGLSYPPAAHAGIDETASMPKRSRRSLRRGKALARVHRYRRRSAAAASVARLRLKGEMNRPSLFIR